MLLGCQSVLELHVLIPGLGLMNKGVLTEPLTLPCDTMVGIAAALCVHANLPPTGTPAFHLEGRRQGGAAAAAPQKARVRRGALFNQTPYTVSLPLCLPRPQGNLA